MGKTELRQESNMCLRGFYDRKVEIILQKQMVHDAENEESCVQLGEANPLA